MNHFDCLTGWKVCVLHPTGMADPAGSIQTAIVLALQ